MKAISDEVKIDANTGAILRVKLRLRKHYVKSHEW